MDQGNNDVNYEFAAGILSLVVPLLLLFIPFFLFFAIHKHLDLPWDLVYGFALVYGPIYLSGIAYFFMGRIVNKQVERVDMLSGNNEGKIIQLYYRHIGKYKKFPVLLVLFWLGVVILAVEVVWVTINLEGVKAIIGLSLLVMQVLLFVIIHFYVKKHKDDNLPSPSDK